MSILSDERPSYPFLSLIGEEPLGLLISQSNVEGNREIGIPRGMQNKLIFPEDHVESYQAPKRIPTRRTPNPKYYPRPIRTSSGKLVRDPNGKVLRLDFAGAVYKFLCRVATDKLNHRFHVEGITELPSVEEFSDELWDVLNSRIPLVDRYDLDGVKPWGALTTEQADKQATDAAVFTLRVWSKEYFSDAARRGRTGGSRSRRSRKFTSADHDRVAGLSIAQAAAVLGCSPRTVSNLREAHR